MTAISVKDLWLGFRLKRRGRSRLVSTVARLVTGKTEMRWALKGLTFDVPRGQFLGIIGPNGSGKTTLLRCLGGIFLPNKGSVTIKGHVSNLIDSRSGASRELSLRENLYMGGAIHGVPRRVMHERLEEIVDFAELQEVVDQPLATFSAGMLMRVSFSLAVSLRPDIFVVDEVLAVGDEAFKAKCLRKVESMRQQGTTIVFVSHELPLVQAHCERVLVLSQGAIAFDGEAEPAIAKHCEILGVSVEEALVRAVPSAFNVRGWSRR